MAPVSMFHRLLKSPIETLTLISRRHFSPLSMAHPSPNFSVPAPPPSPARLIPVIRLHLNSGKPGARREGEVKEKFDRKPKAQDLESEESLRNLYERWLAHYKLSRPDPSEKEARFEIFKERAKKIYEFNSRGTATYTQGLTKFVDSDDHKPDSKYPFFPKNDSSDNDDTYTEEELLRLANRMKEAEENNYFLYTKKDLESDDTVWSLYERWITHHNLSRSPSEKSARFQTFKMIATALSHGFKYPTRIGLDEFADCDFEERVKVAKARRREQG